MKLSLFSRGFNVLFKRKTPALRVVKDDPGDDKSIECASAHRVGFIISGDKALKAIKAYKRIKIVSPQEFLKIFKK